MAKPVEAEQVVIGVIVAENKKGSDGAPNPLSGFSDNDMLVLRTLADYTVIALDNARLAKLSSAMEEIYQVISEPQEFSEVLKHILVIMRKIIPYTTASLMLLEGGKLKIRQSQGFEPEEEARVNLFEFPLDESYPNYQVIINRTATIISDIRASKYDHFWKKAQDYCSGHIRCWMGVPLISGENLLGMLSIDDRRPGRYSRLHQELAMAFANRIAPIITTARLLRIPNKLLYVSQEITEDLDLVGVLRNIVDGAINKEGLAADAAIIYPYHPDTQQFDRPVYAGRLLQPERIMTPRSAESVVYKVLGLNQPHVAVEARGDPVLDREFVEREGIQSAIALPILFGSTSVGVMFVNYFSRHVFHYAEIKLVEIFAQFGAIGIRNARRFGAAERLAFLGPISATWSHELRNNFYNISTEVASLQRVLHKGSAIDPGLVEGILARLDKNARDLLSIVTRINIPTDESMTLVSLQEVLENVIDEQAADQPGSSPLINIQNRLENLPPVRAHERGLDFVFSELISNAARELRASGGSIHIAGWVEGDMVNIEVSDTGLGIPDGYIRDQLFKNSPVNGAQGSGLGLNFVKTVLDMYNGNIKLTNWINGATFRVILPVGTP
jgi:signal transduction histidine kinase/putative methionine-R-sulfoxide reductase with GAF domain